MFVDYSAVFHQYDESFVNVYGQIDALAMACSAMARRLPDSKRKAVNSELLQSLEKLKQEKYKAEYLKGYECIVSQVTDSQQRAIGAQDDVEK